MTEPVDPIYDELRRKYPQLPDRYWREMQRHDRLQTRFDRMRDGLIYLVAYHGNDDGVLLDKLRALLDEQP